MKKFAAILLTLALLLSIGAASADELTTIKVGATTSPHAEVLEYIKDDMAALALPVTILGGTLYHLIFEAKAQYAYPYMVYMLPLAAIGLCRLEEGIKGLWKTKERRR